ncbi:MAG: glycosyltransferase [Acidimicrobiales bacterium]
MVEPLGTPDVGDLRSVVVASQRDLHPKVARCCGYEFEDTIAEIEGAAFVTARHSAVSKFSPHGHLTDHLTRHVRAASHFNLGLRRHHLADEASLFFAQFQFGKDLVSLKALGPWRSRSTAAVALVEEVWPGYARKHWRQFRPLRDFDHIFLECAASTQIVEEITGVPTSYVPPGVDALRFAPTDLLAERPIDMTWIGRRSAPTHGALMTAAERGEIFYYYDSIWETSVRSAREHRIGLANLLKRSRYFMANTAKFNDARADSEEIGFRFFEGAAAGTVMIGTPPRTPYWDELFGWEDSIFRLPYHSEDVLDLMAELDAQPERIEAARRRNIAFSMLRHDWVHRWETILSSVGLDLNPAGIARKRELHRRAAELLSGSVSASTPAAAAAAS